MVQLKLTKISSAALASTLFTVGQVIYCTDNKKCYYDHSNGQRYNSIENYLIIYNSYSDFTSTNVRYMNKVYIDLSTSKFYKFNFESVQFELVYTDTELVSIITQNVALAPVTLQDIKSGNYVAPVTTSSNVYSITDGTTTLDQILSKDLYITNTSGAYVQAVYDNQKVFKIPFPVAKYSLYRDHMTVVRSDSGKAVLMSTETYKVNNGYLVINDNVAGIPKDDRLLFMFYYTRTSNLNESQIIDTGNLSDGCVTIEKLDPFMEIPIYMIKQSDDMQTVNEEEKAAIHAFQNFKITEVDANIVKQNNRRMFVDEGMYNLLVSMIEHGDTGVPTVIAYIHPDTHPASMIMLRDLGEDLEQYSRTIEERWLNTKQIYSGDIQSKADLDKIRIPGNYTIRVTDILNVPVKGDAKLEVDTSDGKEYIALENEWITQKITFRDASDSVRIFFRSCSNATYDFSDWTEFISTTTGVNSLDTTAKDIIGAINEVFQFANNGKAKWLEVIGYPLDKYDTFSNLYEKTKLIKQKFVDTLVAKGVTCTIDTSLQDLVTATKNLLDTRSPKTGNIASGSTTKTFTDGTNSFDSYFIEVSTLYITIGSINIYKDGSLYASINLDNNGIYSIGNLNKKFKLSTNGAYLTNGFRLPVEAPSTSYTYYAVPK